MVRSVLCVHQYNVYLQVGIGGGEKSYTPTSVVAVSPI